MKESTEGYPDKSASPKNYDDLKEGFNELHHIADIDFSRTYSYADYFNWKFDERLELIRGKVFRMRPAPSSTHQRICGRVYVKFYEYLHEKTCEVFIAPFDVRLPVSSTADDAIFTVLQPDICVVCDPAKIDERGCLGAPDLVVEVLSPGNNRKELINKYKAYEEAGVQEYWIINPEKKLLSVYSLGEGNSYRELDLVAGMKNSLFPDLGLRMEELFGTGA